MIPHVVPVNIDQPAMTKLFGDGEIPKHVRSWFSELSLVISFVSNGADQWATNIRALAPQAQIAFVPPRCPAYWSAHISDWHQHVLVEQGVSIMPRVPEATMNVDGDIIIHPGSGGRDKCWNLDRYQQLADTLRGEGLPVRFVVGEVELDRWTDRQLSAIEPTVLTDLMQLYYELLSARVYIGNDAGPTHLAAQTGLPAIALFGPTDPARWAPRGPGVRVVVPPQPCPMDWLDVSRVHETIAELLAS